MKRIIIVIFCLFLFGCDQFPISKKYDLTIKDDTLIRFNEQTGEIVIVKKDGNLIKVDNAFINKANLSEAPSELKTNKNLNFPMSSKMWSTLKYKWRNENILFRYEFGPYSDEIQSEMVNNSNSITIVFVDEDGFDIIKERILLSDCLRTIGDNNLPSYWSYKGKVSCDKKNFDLLSYYSQQWRFSDKLDQKIAEFNKEAKEKEVKIIVVKPGESSNL
jgi:hypothetical protein